MSPGIAAGRAVPSSSPFRRESSGASSAASCHLRWASERTHGTLVRLQTAPLTRAAVLAGKGLGCFLAAMSLQTIMFALATIGFHVHVHSFALLLMAMTSAAAGFVGIMMLV